MAIINNSQGLFITLPVNTKYDPTNPGVEDFPTHYDQNGYGGFVAVNSSISEVSGASSLTGKYNLIIPTKRRKDGMMIYDTNPEVASFYQCTDATAGFWEEVDFKFRYFYGATAPTAPDIQVGEKWFDTVVGSEYTYLPIADGSTYKAWVDIDHIGEGETFSGYMTVDLANTYYVNIGGDEMTGSLTAEKMFRSSSDTSFEDDELVTKSYVSTNFAQSSGGVFTQQITGTDAKFSGGVTAAKFYGTQPISEDTQLATKQYVDNNTIGGVSFYIDGQESPFATSVEAISLSGGSNVNIEYDQSTTPNRYVISASLSTTDEYVNIDGDVMTGTLTGPFAAFTQGITASNGFIGTLTGNYVKIGSDPSYILNFGTTADQSVYSGDNPNVPVINSQGGVLIGGNTYTKQNWLGNNVYLAPEGHVFAGIPSNIPTDWFDADGGTYPFNLYSLNVTGGIHTDRAYRWGHKKGQNTFLDDEFVTRKSVMMRPVIEDGSDSIVYSEFWAQNPNEDDFFDSLTKKKMGFDFPIDITFKVAATRGTSYSSRWYIKRFTNVAPVNNGTEIRIYVDRSLQLKLNGIISGPENPVGPVIRETVGGNLSNNFIMTGYLEGSATNGTMWYFLDITPSPTGPIQY